MAALRVWWSQRRATILILAIVLMALLAAEMLVGEFWRLIASARPLAAVDLKILRTLVSHWFDGDPVFVLFAKALHPPASYLMLWPLLGWLPLAPARWFWAGTSVLALAVLTSLVVRGSGARTVLERLFVALMVLSMNAVGATIGNGQLLVHVLPALIASILLLDDEHRSWWAEMLGVLLFLFSLVKVSGSAPFFWIVLFLPKGWRSGLLTVAGYSAVSLVAAQYQTSSLWVLLDQWLARGSAEATKHGYGHLALLCESLGFGDWILPLALAVLISLGVWIYRHRHCDRWLLMGVTGIVARLWIYHRLYDDVLVILPMVALLRFAKEPRSDSQSDVVAGLLLASMLSTTLTPTRLYYSWSYPWPLIFSTTHVIIWIAALVFLLLEARR